MKKCPTCGARISTHLTESNMIENVIELVCENKITAEQAQEFVKEKKMPKRQAIYFELMENI